MTLYSFLANVFNRIMSLFLPAKVNKPIQNGLRVNIKYGKLKVVSLNIQPHWTVKEVKDHLENELNVPAGQLKIIFAGKQLDDSLQIHECDVGNHTILNAVCAKERNDTELSNNEIDQPSSSKTDSDSEEATKCIHPLVESVLRLQYTGEERSDMKLNDPKKVHFFVYCSNTKCNKICPGKLRVRCVKCKQGTLTVDKDPDCWDDVLNPTKIIGVCHGDSCDGNIAEFFFKCASYHQENASNATTIEEDKCIPLQHIKNNFKAVPCLACTDISQIILVFPCEKGHVICLDCFKDFCGSRLQERGFVLSENYGYTLSCPIQCENSFICEPHHFKLLDNDQYERFQRFGAEECLLAAGGVLCPQIGCGEGIIPDDDCRRIVCASKEQGGQGCGFVFCRICLQGYHIGECEEEYLGGPHTTGKNDFFVDGVHGEMSRWQETASKNTIKGTTKPCPKCRTPTEKDAGCMHMVCRCGFHWCWICQTEWTRECMGSHWFA